MTNPTTSKNERIALCQALIAALRKRVTKPRIELRGKLSKKADVIARLERYVEALREADRVLLAWRNATNKASRLYFDDIHGLFGDMRSFVINFYGPLQLTRFGFKRLKSGRRSPASKVVAAEKARATRKARGTKGKRQRKAIRGAIAAVAPVAPAT